MGYALTKTAIIIMLATVSIIFAVSTIVEAGQGASPPNKGASVTAGQEEYIYIVSKYRYESIGSKKNVATGQSICGTRCNAMSADYKNYLYPNGWRIKKVAIDQEVVVDLNNPFIKGKCTCVADKYLVKVNDLYMSKIRQ